MVNSTSEVSCWILSKMASTVLGITPFVVGSPKRSRHCEWFSWSSLPWSWFCDCCVFCWWFQTNRMRKWCHSNRWKHFFSAKQKQTTNKHKNTKQTNKQTQNNKQSIKHMLQKERQRPQKRRLVLRTYQKRDSQQKFFDFCHLAIELKSFQVPQSDPICAFSKPQLLFMRIWWPKTTDCAHSSFLVLFVFCLYFWCVCHVTLFFWGLFAFLEQKEQEQKKNSLVLACSVQTQKEKQKQKQRQKQRQKTKKKQGISIPSQRTPAMWEAERRQQDKEVGHKQGEVWTTKCLLCWCSWQG